jgi:aconitate hydratase
MVDRSKATKPAARRVLRPSLSCVDLDASARAIGLELKRLPRSHRILLENVLVHEGLTNVYVSAFPAWLHGETREIPFRPARILSHDTAGIAMLADLAALRDKIASEGGDPSAINSAVPIDLVVDHSVAADVVATPDAMAQNMQRELERNRERYRFLRWAERSLGNLRIIPPGNGICHQVNMELLATGIVTATADKGLVLADTVIGTDSHTTMINALGILGWGVGGIEAEAVAMGEALMMALPPVTGCRLVGRRAAMISASDIVLFIVQALRRHGVVAKIVEFHGEGLDQLSMGDRAAIANMAPEYGATCGLFPIDEVTIRYFRETGRAQQLTDDIANHAMAAGLWRDDGSTPSFTDELVIDLSQIVPIIAGPKRPQQITTLSDAPASFKAAFPIRNDGEVRGAPDELCDGDIVIAAITSCTHTSNPHQMLAAGLLARNAHAAGLKRQPWVKTSLSPGSRAVGDYLQESGLQAALDALGFNVVGYGCMTCAGNSGALAPELSAQIRDRARRVCAVLSANRNFEGRTHPDLSGCYLAAPALVVAYALAGTILVDLTRDPLCYDSAGRPVRLADIWPSDDEIDAYVRRYVTPETYRRAYDPDALARSSWSEIVAPTGAQFPWDPESTFVQRPPFFRSETRSIGLSDLAGARPLAVLGDNITTDHISPFGRILPDSAAARYLTQRGVPEDQWSSYAERRGNHEVLWRGTFSNPNLRNALAGGKAGGFTTGPDGSLMNIVDAAELYRDAGVPTVVFAGREYGTGSSRDWAAKGTRLMGVKAVIAESFERIHRANLVGVGVVPCQLPEGVTVASLGIRSDTTVSIEGLAGLNGPMGTVRLVLKQADGSTSTISMTCRIDTQAELEQIREGGLFATAEAAARDRAG